MFKGSWVALVTPFHSNYSIDQKALENLVAWHMTEGTTGLVVGGSTGEGMLLNIEEHNFVLEICLKTAQNKIPIVASISAMRPEDSQRLAQQAQTLGATGLMLACPPYVKPTQKAIINFVTQVHDQTNLPIIIYNNPGRCSVTMNFDTIIELACLPRIVCLKDATGQIIDISKLKSHLPENFTQLCGEDALNVAALAEGSDGWISVTANIAPRLCAQLYQAWHQCNLEAFAHIRTLLNPLHRAIFVETSPSPVKYALAQQGLCRSNVRLPLLEATPVAQKAIHQALDFINQSQQNLFVHSLDKVSR